MLSASSALEAMAGCGGEKSSWRLFGLPRTMATEEFGARLALWTIEPIPFWTIEHLSRWNNVYVGQLTNYLCWVSVKTSKLFPLIWCKTEDRFWPNPFPFSASIGPTRTKEQSFER